MQERSFPWHVRVEAAAIALHYQLAVEDAIAEVPNCTPIDKKKYAHERDKTTALMWLIKQHLQMNSGPTAEDLE
jgi:hypothetical protein